MTENGEWLEYRRLVLSEITRLDERLSSIATTLNLMALEINTVQGGLAGARADILQMKSDVGRLSNVLRDIGELREDISDINRNRRIQSQSQWQFWAAVVAAAIGSTGLLLLALVQSLR